MQPTISRFFKAVSVKEADAGLDETNAGNSVDNSIMIDDSEEDDSVAGAAVDVLSTVTNADVRAAVEEEEEEEDDDPSVQLLSKYANAVPDKRNRSGSASAMSEGRDRSHSTSVDAVNFDTPPIKKRKKAASLTPLDQQVKELKQNNNNKLLVIRVGYKYKCFAQDAIVASKALHLKLVPGKLTFDESNPQDAQFKQYAYCSFPDTRLNVHLERLIHHNLKVGVVEQQETGAIKKQTNNKTNVFERKVTNTFSKATYGINTPYSINNDKSAVLGDTKSIWALSIVAGEKGTTYHLLSVNLNSGEVIHDTFNDSLNSTDELFTRVKYLDPFEVTSLNSKNDIHVNILNLFKQENCSLNCTGNSPKPEASLDSVVRTLKLSSEMTTLVHLLYNYLMDYNNEKILEISSNYKTFGSKVHMTLDGHALESLDIFSNDGKKGSLVWLMDHTRTPFGFRQLRQWISKPLVQQDEIDARLDAVDCISKEVSGIFFEALNQMLKTTPDLMRTLNRIAYGNTSRKEVYFFLKQINGFIDHFKKHSNQINNEICSVNGKIYAQSRILREIFTQIRDIFQSTEIPRLLSMINVIAVMDKDQVTQAVGFFNLNNYDNSEDIIAIQRDIEGVKRDLMDELKNIKRILKRPHLEYRDTVEYLVEVRNTQVKGLPDDWIKVNNTKAVSRFSTPVTAKLTEKLQYHKELLMQKCNDEYERFLGKVNKEYPSLKVVIQNLASYDCILSLAATSCNVNYVRPKFVTDAVAQTVAVKNGRNPIIESLNVHYVPNDVNIKQSDNKINIITGPNMGGKSSYIRQVALLIIMSQIGSYVPADHMETSIFDKILTRIGAHDDLLRGDSTFKVEMMEILNILRTCTPKSLLLLDEVGRGTGTLDGRAISYALLKYFVELENCPLILFTTHFSKLSESLASKHIKNFYMDYVEEKNDGENWSSVIFLYNLIPGSSNDSFGLNVAKLANLDKDIINRAYEISEKTKQEELEAEATLKLGILIKNVLQAKEEDRLKILKILDIGLD
ncbi:hypothetical protein KAFR_0J02610 [Kazachstania africana CBS 2517]|uniref:DNA mismatch repair protein MSH3 n=1 Tax=Kazachstania africana (strain ATCC 22294 / BCRC 22015 / CBS 2517 / CECT 1963 / NBRC 1671 / NRRL Y-8276) TaxID=1071382 RepID=H2B125_KAZAF|nr:hypothetical protein KAFR_0J02610 [Kazachstania africana CBS 2517]CCF60325.1 hypothetical protein KAFR_0J02610 [Kazachstania africana CBS 2517]